MFVFLSSSFLRFVDFQPLVQIGPPNAEFLKLKDKSTWSAKDVADSVLADKSALVLCSPCLFTVNTDSILLFFFGEMEIDSILL